VANEVKDVLRITANLEYCINILIRGYLMSLTLGSLVTIRKQAPVTSFFFL